MPANVLSSLKHKICRLREVLQHERINKVHFGQSVLFRLAVTGGVCTNILVIRGPLEAVVALRSSGAWTRSVTYEIVDLPLQCVLYQQESVLQSDLGPLLTKLTQAKLKQTLNIGIPTKEFFVHTGSHINREIDMLPPPHAKGGKITVNKSTFINL